MLILRTIIKTAILCAPLFLTIYCGSNARRLIGAFEQYGTVYVNQFQYAPFPHPARENGHVHEDQFFPAELHYSDRRAAVFVPRYFKAGPGVDLVIYLHGWYGNLEKTFFEYPIVDQFARSKKNAILVVPAGPKNAADSFGGHFEEPDGFNEFVYELLEVLRARGVTHATQPGKIILAAHSGGYRSVAQILKQGGLERFIYEVYIFDGLYGRVDEFEAWIAQDQGRFVSIYTESGGTLPVQLQLMHRLRQQHIDYYQDLDMNLNDEMLMHNQNLFLESSAHHRGVVYAYDQLCRLLSNSVLENRVIPASVH